LMAVMVMRHWVWFILLFSANILKAVPLPPEPSLDIEAKVRGQFTNWVTGEEQTVFIQPQVIWATPNELPNRADLLRQAIKSEWRRAILFLPDFWRLWNQRTIQPLKPPHGWLIWDVSRQRQHLLQLQVSVRDKRKRLTQVRLVTVHEEVKAKAVNGMAKVVWAIKPTDAGVLILQGRSSVLAFLPMRWTPLVYAERVGIVAEVGPVPVPIGKCEECQRGRAIAQQIYEKLRPPKEGFVWVFQRLRAGSRYPIVGVDVPHFRIKPVVMFSKLVAPGRWSVLAEFFKSLPPLDPNEAAKIAHHEAREAILYRPSEWLSRRAQILEDEWWIYEVQKRRFVVAVWEVRVRRDIPTEFSTYNEAVYRTREIAKEVVKALLSQPARRLSPHPLEPPNNVAGLLVEKIRPKVSSLCIGLMPRATLWFDGVIVAYSSSFKEPKPGSFEQEELQIEQEKQRMLREGQVELAFVWKGLDEPLKPIFGEKGGSVKIRWLNWLTQSRRKPPLPSEWQITPPDTARIFTDAEYEIVPNAPNGFQTIEPFRLTVKTTKQPSELSAFPTIKVSLHTSDQRVAVMMMRGDFSRPLVQGWIGIPHWLVTLLKLRVTFNYTPVSGKVTVILEGNGRRWKREGFAQLVGSWDIPVHPRWYFPDPDRPKHYTDMAIFRYIPPGKYKLKVEGTIGGKASVDVSLFPGKQQIVTRSEPIREVRWQKIITINIGDLDTVVVPLPPP
jgi:hypothetical protein